MYRSGKFVKKRLVIIRNKRRNLHANQTKFSMCGKAISTSFLTYTQVNKQRNLKSIP